jgi:lipoprotein-releasing system permease protein
MNENKKMNFLTKSLLILTGPIWLLLVYWPWQVIVGLFGVCYYLVLVRTPNVLFPSQARSRRAVALRWYLIPLVLLGLIPAMAIQILVMLWHLFVWWHKSLGQWQTGFEKTVPAVIAGLIAEAAFILVFIGSFHHPLPWSLMGYSDVPQRWYRYEATDPVRILLTGPFLIGLFWMVLVPTLLTGLWPKVKKFVFLPGIALSVVALYTSLIPEEMIVNLRWTQAAGIMFLSVVLIAMMMMAWRTLHRPTSLRQFVWFSAIRLLEKKRIALFSLAAVTLCTAMLLIIMSVMGGFVEQVRNKSHGAMGDIILQGDEIRGFPYYEGFIELLKKPPYDQIVEEVTPVVFTAGLMRVPKPMNPSSSWTNTVQIQGIDLKGRIATTQFGKSLNLYNRDPKLVTLDKPISPPNEPEADKLFGLIYGLDVFGLAERDRDGNYHRLVQPYNTATLSMIPINRKGTLIDASAPAITQKFYMIDDSRTGIYEIDAKFVYVGFDVLQRLLYMSQQEAADGKIVPARTHQVHIKLKPGVDLNNVGLQKIQMAWWTYSYKFEDPLLENVSVNTWEDYNATYIAAVENEKRLMVILFGIVSVVAVFLILAIFYMIVVEKTRDIGILKSIGASAYQIAAIFLAYAGAIGFVGSIIGSTMGYYFVKHINGIQDWLIQVFGWRVWNREVYSFDRIPGEVRSEDMIMIIIAAIVASIIGAIIPAIRAAKMNPVEALRYE